MKLYSTIPEKSVKHEKLHKNNVIKNKVRFN